MTEQQTCTCGEPDCWAADDYSWLKAGWGGEISGCDAAVFFIHGKKIREQRHFPEGEWPIDTIGAQFAAWAQGLPGARLVYHSDTGDGEPGWWIEGEREPNDEDLKRLREVQDRTEGKERRELERLRGKYGESEA